MQAQRKTLSSTEADFERQRFTYYSAERGSKLDTRAKEALELYHNDRDNTNTQYTATQLATLEETGAPIISLNFIYPIISHMKGVLTADKPIGRVVPDTDADKQKAYLYEELMNAIWRNSKANAAYSKVVKECLITYLSALMIEPSSFYRPGVFDLTISHVAWDDLYIDPDARESGLNFRDAEAIYLARLIPKRKIRNIYGFQPEDTESDLKSDVYNRTDETDNPYVLVRDIYEKQYGIHALLHGVDPNTGAKEAYRKVFKSQKALDAYSKKGGFQPVSFREGVYVRHRLLVGRADLVVDDFLPLTEYPFAIFTADDHHNPFGRSVTEYLRELQKARNKFWQLVYLNAMLSSNTRFMGPAGSFVDKDAWSRYGATAGHTYEYKSDPSLPDGGRPTIIQPLPLNAAFYTLQDQMEQMAEYISGQWKPQMGNMQFAPDNVGGTQAILQAGTARLKDLKSRFAMAVANGIWKPGLQYINYYAQRDQVVRYLDSNDELKEIKLDDILDDETIQEHDVQISLKTSLPSDRERLVSVMENAMQHATDPNMYALAFQYSLELQDFPITDAFRQKIDIVQRLTGQVEQLQGELEEAQKQVEQMSSVVQDADRAIADAEHRGNLKADRAKMAGQAAVALNEVKQGPSMTEV